MSGALRAEWRELEVGSAELLNVGWALPTGTLDVVMGNAHPTNMALSS